MRFPTHRSAAALLIFLVVAAAPALAALFFPTLTGRVVDDAHLLNANQVRKLTAKLASEEASTSNQIVVVTLPSLQGTTIEDYGYQLGRTWGIGQKGRDNGVLLIVAPNERKVRIEVGYGLEGNLTDALAKVIIENDILPAFRRGDYPAGIEAGVDSIVAAVAGSYEPLAKKHPSQERGRFVVALIFLAISLLAVYLRSGIFFVSGPGIMIGHRGRRGRGGFGGGGFGGGGGGGGFGGGGGGFGGGGSSGSW